MLGACLARRRRTDYRFCILEYLSRPCRLLSGHASPEQQHSNSSALRLRRRAQHYLLAFLSATTAADTFRARDDGLLPKAAEAPRDVDYMFSDSTGLRALRDGAVEHARLQPLPRLGGAARGPRVPWAVLRTRHEYGRSFGNRIARVRYMKL